MYIMLQRATDITRDEQGTATSWRGTGETLATFTKADDFIKYVEDNAADLKDVIAFTGSASLLLQANAIIADKAKKAGVKL